MPNKKNAQNVNQRVLSNKGKEGIYKDIYVKNVIRNSKTNEGNESYLNNYQMNIFGKDRHIQIYQIDIIEVPNGYKGNQMKQK